MKHSFQSAHHCLISEFNNMRKVITFLFSLFFCLDMYQCRPTNEVLTELPNIILCMADDQGWGDMGYNGHRVIQTPNFDDMAAEALRFDRFYAAAPVCSPTRGSVMTGRHPNRFACFSWGYTLRPQEITIAEVLKRAGYVTGHFGKWHLGSVRQGSPVNPGAVGFDKWFSAPNFFDNNPILSLEGIAMQTEGESSMVAINAALEFIRKHEGRKKPYFVVVWFGSPHLPHKAYEEDRKLYCDQPDDLEHFYGEISGMDRAFGKLRAELKKLSTYKNTILWYCSDNGGLPRVGSTGGRGHKGDVYEGGLRVPAIMEWPAKIKESRITQLPASTSDIFLTLLDIVGLQVDASRPYDGISLVPLLDGQIDNRTQPMGFWHYPASGIPTPSAEWMTELLESQKNGNMVGDSSRLRLEDIKIKTQYPLDTLKGHAAWLDWPWKLHRIYKKSGDIQWELYRLDEDPQESLNQLNREPERVSKMKMALEEWQRSVVRSMNGGDY
ncbi:MAG: sulfatase-like hydrolase/transferase [Bacteroidales bacterium]|nr:MAG: sulfatase-like hydrolase/transferase [Bacteroidales bacterium]